MTDKLKVIISDPNNIGHLEIKANLFPALQHLTQSVSILGHARNP